MNKITRRRFVAFTLAIAISSLTLALPQPAKAAVVTNTSVSFASTLFVPCVPEFAFLTGKLHVLITSEVDSNGGTHFKSHYQPQGISGFGLVTGDRYQGTGVTQRHINTHTSLASEQTFVNNFRIIGMGTGANYLVHTTIHVSVDANGNVTANVLNTSVECR